MMYWCSGCHRVDEGRTFEYTCQTCNASMCARCADRHRKQYRLPAFSVASTFSATQVRETTLSEMEVY